MTTYAQLLAYYANLLTVPYNQAASNSSAIAALCAPILMSDNAGSTLPLDVLNGFNMNPTVQTLTFSAPPTSGSFVLSYGGSALNAIAANATLDTLTSTLQSFFGAYAVTVAGTPGSGPIVISFIANAAPVAFVLSSSNLMSGSSSVAVTLSTNLAIGAQLDTLAGYAGVTRTGTGLSGEFITLTDAQLFMLLRIAIANNRLDSSMLSIQTYLNTYFPGAVFAFSYANSGDPMSMSYLINLSAVDEPVVELAVVEGLLPVPMGVSVSIIAAPVINEFFSWSDYALNGTQPPNTTPLNCIAGYSSGNVNTSSFWIDYSDSFI